MLASFSEYAQNRDFEAASVFRNSINKIPMKKACKNKRAIFSIQEVTILLSLPDSSKGTGLRDKSILSLMYPSGARAQEICDLIVGNIQFHPKGAALNMKGKGGKRRRIGIHNACAIMLKKYIVNKNLNSEPHVRSWSSFGCYKKFFRTCFPSINTDLCGGFSKYHRQAFKRVE